MSTRPRGYSNHPVRPEQILWLADQLRERQVQLEETLAEVVERGTSINELEGRLIAEASSVRRVEAALRHEAMSRDLSIRLAASLPSWTKPRIGGCGTTSRDRYGADAVPPACAPEPARRSRS